MRVVRERAVFVLTAVLLAAATLAPARSSADLSPPPRSAAAIPAASRPAVTAAAGSVPVGVIAGETRFETAVAASRRAYPSGADSVVIATGLDWPDALGGAALAGASGGPILLVRPDCIPLSVAEELRRLSPRSVYVLGSPAAVAPKVVSRVRASVSATATVRRLSGPDRYATAVAVASEVTRLIGPTWDGEAFVATGRGFADALAAGPLSAALPRPVYLIDDRSAARVAVAMKAAGARSATLLGGGPAVSASAARTVSSALGGPSTTSRLAGRDRYATALAIASRAVSDAGFTWRRPGLASSVAFPDALAGSVVLGAERSPLLLAPPDGLPDSEAAALYARRAGVEGFIALGGRAALPLHVRQEAQHALLAPAFRVSAAMGHVRALADLGPRRAGFPAERKGCDYVKARLQECGYAVTVKSIDIPHGRESRDVIAEKAGASGDVIVIGAHIDSKYPSPGGNDNATGVAVALELARLLASAPTQPTVRFIAFGAEEISGDGADDHHFGSRQYVGDLSSAGRREIAGMVSVDMVGYGTTFNVRSMDTGPQAVVSSLRKRASFVGVELPYLRDPGRYGWSDHEGFERAGIPAAWLEWREDPVYHTRRDTASHVQPSRVRVCGRLLRGWLLGMTSGQLAALR